MKQTQKPAEQITATNNDELKQKLDKLTQAPPKEKRYRTVRLLYSSCCGCGCYDVQVRRKVEYDSPLRDGDRIEHIEDNDEY